MPAKRLCTRRRAMGYAVVMSVAMLVSVIGMAALMAARLQWRSAVGISDATNADQLARATLELLACRLKNDSNWRNTYAHDTWSNPEDFEDMTFSFRLVDEVDADLTDDVSDPVRIYSQATTGTATRMYSALLVPQVSTPVNLIENGDVEAGLSGWSAYGSSSIQASTINPHGGAQSVYASNLLLGTVGAAVNIPGPIKSGVTYYLEFWVRGSNVSSTKTLSIVTSTNAGTITYGGSFSTSNSTWTRISGTLTTYAYATIDSAYLEVKTSVQSVLTGSLNLDDVVFVEGNSAAGVTPMFVRAGSVRREVAP